MTSEEILEWWESDADGSIWGYMYGSPMEPRGKRFDEIIEWNKNELSLGKYRDCFIVQWGWPGPDFNIYNFSDYGRTWAFTKEEIDLDWDGVTRNG